MHKLYCYVDYLSVKKASSSKVHVIQTLRQSMLIFVYIYNLGIFGRSIHKSRMYRGYEFSVKDRTKLDMFGAQNDFCCILHSS